MSNYTDDEELRRWIATHTHPAITEDAIFVDEFGVAWHRPKKIKCECGAEKLKLAGHSDWCPKTEEEKSQ